MNEDKSTILTALFLALVMCFSVSPAAAALVVPGTDSSIDLHVDGSLTYGGPNNTPISWNNNQHIVAGANWPNPTTPPNAAAWTLDPGVIVDGVQPQDYSAGHTIAAFGYNYLPQETDILLRSSSTGVAVGTPGNSFSDHSTVNGRLSLWLEPTNAGDAGAFFDVNVTVRITGTELSAGPNAHAFMNHSSRIDPLLGGNGVSDFTGQYSDVTLPPLNPGPGEPYLIEQTYFFHNIQAGSEFTFVDLGINNLDGLLTSTNGATTGTITSTDANSIFDSTMSLDFVATPLPEPSTFVLAALGLIGLVAVARRKKNRTA
jgi:PEP-CTERM motif